MQNVRPWQVVLFVVAVIGLATGVFIMSSGRGLDLSDSIIMVDVETGELFRFSVAGNRGVGVPNFNPDSGNLSLLPVKKDENGEWRLTERSRPILADLDVKPEAVVDVETGEIVTVGIPQRVSQKTAPDPD